MQRIGMIGAELENSLIERPGLVETARLVVLERQREGLVEGERGALCAAALAPRHRSLLRTAWDRGNA